MIDVSFVMGSQDSILWGIRMGSCDSMIAEYRTGLMIVIVKASSGPRYVVSYRPTLPAHKVSYAELAELPQADAAVEAGCPGLVGHDHPYHHAYSPKRSRSYGQ